MKKVVTHSLGETYHAAAQFVEKLNDEVLTDYENKDGATVLTLCGDLGAGKTAFVQGLARALHINEQITSPTFVLMKQYAICAGHDMSFNQLCHIDAYRLENELELKPLGWDKLLLSMNNLIALEWPERVARALSNIATIPIHFRFIDENTREITLPF